MSVVSSFLNLAPQVLDSNISFLYYAVAYVLNKIPEAIILSEHSLVSQLENVSLHCLQCEDVKALEMGCQAIASLYRTKAIQNSDNYVRQFY